MNFDLYVATAAPFATPGMLAACGAEAEDRGVHRLWASEHAVLFDEYQSQYPYAEDGKIPAPPDTGILEPLTTLTFLAAHTTTVRLGTGILLLAQRNPVYAAKEVATLDWLSGGRVDLGIGVGWLREEYEAVNVPWPRRGARTDECIEVLRTLWCEDPSSFDGDTYHLPQCSMYPKPVQDPHPPLHIGGESDAALRRVARLGQGWLTFNRLPEDLAEPLARLEGFLAEQGRERADVEVTVCPYFQALTPERVERYAAAGADAVAALCFATSADEVPAMLDQLGPCLARAAAC